MKRSRYVALFSMGASALALAACEDPNELIPTKAYESVAACIADGMAEADCKRAHVAAENAYERAYPQYDSKVECEVNAGIDKCELDHPSSRSGHWRPTMTGFLIGAALGSRVEPQPIVANDASPSRRATAAGVPVGNGVNGNIALRSAAAPNAAQVTKAHTLARGGFGSSASRIASAPSAGRSSGSSRSSGG